MGYIRKVKKNWIGLKFGGYTILEKIPPRHFKCQCNCGQIVLVNQGNLKRNQVGCIKCLNPKPPLHTTHGLHRSPTYRTWADMLNRCNNQNIPAYAIYGARGIRVDPEWKKFKNFLKDMGQRSSSQTLDRIDSNGDYCKNNCRWATRFEQGQNRRNTIQIAFLGQTTSISEWANRLSIDRRVIWERYKKGWDVRRILTQHIMPRRNALL